MHQPAQAGIAERGAAALVLVVPVLAGLVYQTLFGAPQSYIAVNAAALALGVLWAMFGRVPSSDMALRITAIGCAVLLALPLLTGPSIDGVARWLPLGGFTLHIGMTLIPLIAALSARIATTGPMLLLVGMMIVRFHPDMASALALSGAAFGLAIADRSRLAAIVGILGLATAGLTSLTGNLPPQEFVERIIPDLMNVSPIMAVILMLSLIVSLALILRAPGTSRAPRYAVAGSLGGFILAALLGDYPTPLIGYGTAAIIGVALGLTPQRNLRAGPD